MKKLPAILKIGEFDHELIERDDDFAVYRQTSPNGSIAYETIRVQKHKAKSIPNGDGTFRQIEEGEAYPKANLWGSDGWTFQSLEEAKRKLEILRSSVKRQELGGVNA